MALTELTPSRWFRGATRPAATSPTVSSLTGRDDPFTRMHEEMDRLFDNFFNGEARWSVSRPLTAQGDVAALLRPQLDIAESKDAYSISVELPGVDPKNIELSADDETLTIRAEKQRVKKEGDDNEAQFHRIERSVGRFERMLTLPVDADADKISAEYNNGVLEISIPRRADVESTRGRRIEIKSS